MPAGCIHGPIRMASYRQQMNLLTIPAEAYIITHINGQPQAAKKLANLIYQSRDKMTVIWPQTHRKHEQIVQVKAQNKREMDIEHITTK